MNEITIDEMLAIVDYRRSLDEMVNAGRYEYLHDSINEKTFPIKRHYWQKNPVALALFCFNQRISSQMAISEMKKVGYRPGRIEELLALGESQPELQKNFSIVALDSVHEHPPSSRYVGCPYPWGHSDGNFSVPILGCNLGERQLWLALFCNDWSPDTRLLAVRV